MGKRAGSISFIQSMPSVYEAARGALAWREGAPQFLHLRPGTVCGMRFLGLLVLAMVVPGCISIPTSAAAKISYATTVSPWPATVTCLNPPVMTGIAKEVLMGSRLEVVIASGPTPISDHAWATFTPSLGNRKNSDRHTLFARSCFSRSPGKPSSCVGEDCRDVISLDGYTWVGLSKIDAADCLPSASACSGTGANPGGLFVVVTEKCHELTFEGEVIFLRGPRGEKAIMHATSDGNPTTDVSLPEGWSLTKATLAAPLTLRPFGGGDACFYNVIRDSTLQSYHQFEYASSTYP
jgi:hypothetical protein